MKKLMKLPADTSETFPGIPLKGHISALKCGEKKYYWSVDRLIEKSAGLPVFEAKDSEQFVARYIRLRQGYGETG